MVGSCTNNSTQDTRTHIHKHTHFSTSSHGCCCINNEISSDQAGLRCLQTQCTPMCVSAEDRPPCKLSQHLFDQHAALTHLNEINEIVQIKACRPAQKNFDLRGHAGLVSVFDVSIRNVEGRKHVPTCCQLGIGLRLHSSGLAGEEKTENPPKKF